MFGQSNEGFCVNSALSPVTCGTQRASLLLPGDLAQNMLLLYSTPQWCCGGFSL